MDRDTGADSIGLAVRRARRARGLTLAQLAGRIGRSESWLSLVENGKRSLDKRADIAALAEALEVSADALVGQPTPEIQPGRKNWNLQPLRGVLLDASLDDPPDMPARPLPQLRTLNDGIDTALRKADYDTVNRDLPGLLGELQVLAATTSGPDRDEALRLLVLACESASITLRHLGRTDLGWIAADRGRQAAVLLGDPVWSAAAAYGLAHARSSTNRPRALLVAPQVADRLEPHVGDDRFAQEVYGMLHLSAALSRAVQGDHGGAQAHGEEAARVAARLGDRPDAFELFGVANTGVWRTSLAVEAGHAEAALQYATTVEPRNLASGNRRAALAIEQARALAMLDKC